MVENQIYELLNDTAAQVYGSDAVETLDLEGMLSLRDTVLGSGTDKFLNVLVDRIGKTVIRTLDFTATFPKLIMNDFEFGAVLQKISVQPSRRMLGRWAKMDLRRISSLSTRRTFDRAFSRMRTRGRSM